MKALAADRPTVDSPVFAMYSSDGSDDGTSLNESNSSTLTDIPSDTATLELVVPKSIPQVSLAIRSVCPNCAAPVQAPKTPY